MIWAWNLPTRTLSERDHSDPKSISRTFRPECPTGEGSWTDELFDPGITYEGKAVRGARSRFRAKTASLASGGAAQMTYKCRSEYSLAALVGELSLAVSHSLIRIEILSERHGVPAAVIGASVIRRRIALHTSTLGRSYPMARLLSPFGVSLSEVFRSPPCQRSSNLCSGGGGLSLSRRSRPVATGEVAATEQCSIELGSTTNRPRTTL